MQLLTLAGSFFLIVCSVAVQGAENVGPCTKARQQGGPMMPGKYLPQCTEYGFYKATQCHGSIGKCWCVVPDTGKPVDNTNSGYPECTICHIKRSEALRPAGIVGNYVPVCDEDGLFNARQAWGSTGQSWCVNKYTGEEIKGSRSGPGQQSVNCTVAAVENGRALVSQMVNKGPCYAKLIEARGRESTPGFYTPACTTNGYYKTEQHHSSTGYTWCANPATGEEVPNTRRNAIETKVNCGACFKEIEEKLTRKPLLGLNLPQCNNENGEYVPVQHYEGYTYCVNPQTGAVEGKKIAPGDKTPLPCVNH